MLNVTKEELVGRQMAPKVYLIVETNSQGKVNHYFYHSVKRESCAYARAMKKRKPFSIFTVSHIEKGLILELGV